MRRWTKGQKLEVGDGVLSEFAGEKGVETDRKVAQIGEAKPKLNSAQLDDSADGAYYKQNTSRRRCRQKESVVVSLGTPVGSGGSVGPTGKQERDCWKLVELLGVLIFEMIGLALLVGIAAVRQGEILARTIDKWTKESASDGSHKSAKGANHKKKKAKKKEGKKSGKKRERKTQDQPSRKPMVDQQQETMTEEGYRRPGGMSTFPDPASMLGSKGGMSSVGGMTPLVDLAKGAYDKIPWMPMPLPGFVGVPFFKGRDATEFLERFDELCNEYGLVEEQKIAKLPRYCERGVSDVIKTLREWELKDYWGLRRAILKEYKEYDSYQQKFSIQFLEAFKAKVRTDQDDLLHYCRTYHAVAKELIDQGVLSKYIAGVWFLHGLPQTVAAKVMRKYEVDTEDPTTINYDTIREFVMKATSAEKAIQRLNGERVADSSQRRGIRELADKVHAGVGVPKEKEAYETTFVPAGMPVQSAKTDRVMEELTKSFNQLNLNIGALAQKATGSLGQTYPGNREVYPYAEVYQTTSSVGAAGQMLGGAGGDTVGVSGVGMVDIGANGSRRQGTCWYCHNRDPTMRPHRTRDACPLFQHHVAMGTVHLNKEGRIVLGREGEGGPEVMLWASQGPQGYQIIKKVAGTRYDPVIANRPADSRSGQDMAGTGASVGFIAVDCLEGDSDEEEHEFPEGYGQVSVVSIADVDAVRVDKDKGKGSAEGWKNPMKILKKRQEKEKTYATGKAARAGTWEPARVTEVTDEMEVEVEDVKTEDAAEKKKKEVRAVREVVKREKYMDRWKEECRVDEVFDEVMGQRVEIRMKDLLVCSKPLWELMFKGTVRNDQGKEKEGGAQSVSVGGLRSSEWAYAASTPKVKVRLGDVIVDAMLDTGAEVNVMTKALADRAGLTVRTNVRMGMKAVSGGLSKFAGVCEDVEVNIGGIVNLQAILVIPNLAHHKLILGQPFVHDAQVCPYFDEDGYQCIRFYSEDRSKVGTTRVSKPQGKVVRNARVERNEEELSENE
jgi:hypothetical protein